MSTQILYTCDRCKVQNLQDRSGWRTLTIEYNDEPMWLCRTCYLEFNGFMLNRKVEGPALEDQ
jgi:hypothetical protein